MTKHTKEYQTPGAFVARDPKQALALLDTDKSCYHEPGWLCEKCLNGFAEALRLKPVGSRVQRSILDVLVRALFDHAEELGLQTQGRTRFSSDQDLISTLSFLNADFRKLILIPGIGEKTQELGLRLQQGLGLAVHAQRAVQGVDLSRKKDRPYDPACSEFLDRSGYRFGVE